MARPGFGTRLGKAALALAALAAGASPAQTFDLSNINGTNGLVLYGANASDAAGASARGAGDINGDGLGDLAVGAPYAYGGPLEAGAGRAYFVFGQQGGLANGQTLDTPADGTNGFEFVSEDADDYGGLSISGVGDIDGDGFSDVVVAVPYGDGAANGRLNSGEAFVLFGGSGAFTTPLDGSAVGAAQGFRILGGAAGDYAGISVSGVGDINGDGFDDLAVGAPFADSDADSYFEGAVYVILGRSSAFPASIDLGSLGASDGFTLFDSDDDLTDGFRLGSGVAGAGDVNGDGIDDLLVGAGHADLVIGSGNDEGRAYVLFGNTSGFGASFDLAGLTGANGFVLTGIDAGDEAGFSVSTAGDIDGDGLADIVVGAPYAASASNGRPGAGEAYVVFGSESAFSSPIGLGSLGGSDGFVIHGDDTGDQAGFSVGAAGDVNGDGYGDVLIGARNADSVADGRASAGESIVVFGRDTGVSPFGAALDLASLAGSDGLVLHGVANNDFSGSSVSGTGDVNGDGLDDIAIGAPSGDGAGDATNGSGDNYLVYGPLPGSSVPTSATWRSFARTGDAPNSAVGRTANGTQAVPPSRCWIDFDAGDDGAAGASLQTVTMKRDDSAVATGLSPAIVADTIWEISTDRTGWTTARVTLQYLDSEIGGLTESALVLYKGASESGPWEQVVTNFALDTATNRIAADVDSFSWFAISDQPGLPVELDVFGVE